MKFHNMEKIKNYYGITNKYLVTTLVAKRARQISEHKGRRLLDDNGDEKFISLALSEMESASLEVKLPEEKVEVSEGESEKNGDVALEE